jgi:hypothetical protein
MFFTADIDKIQNKIPLEKRLKSLEQKIINLNPEF